MVEKFDYMNDMARHFTEQEASILRREVIYADDLEPPEKLVMLALLEEEPVDAPIMDVTIEDLKECLCRAKRQVATNILRRLEEKGYIMLFPFRGQKPHYIWTFPDYHRKILGQTLWTERQEREADERRKRRNRWRRADA